MATRRTVRLPMDEWRYEPVPDLDQSFAERLRHFPREPEMLVYGLRSGVALLIRGWLKLYHRLEVQGLENLPKEGSFVMAANHSSHLDALCLLSALPLRKLHRAFPAAAADYFFTNLPRTALSTIVVNALPFNRRDHAQQSLQMCRHLLENPGNILIVFPEGTRTTTGELGTFKPGVGILLAGTDIPVMPCYIDGAFRACPKGKFLPRPYKVRLRIGQLRTYENLPPGKESAMAISDDLRNQVLELSHAGHRMI